MNYIFTNTRDNRTYLLNPEITCGNKVCLVDMTTCEDKFVSVSTLKRWYSKSVSNSPVVQVKAFTGMNIGLYLAETNRHGELMVWTKKNALLSFDPDMGTQTNAKNPKFANKVTNTYNWMQVSLDWALS